MARDSDRFLRDPSLRAALYYDADGLCQQCGSPLPEGWHADHVIPWSATHRTNVFEMQALCPKCNLHKGAKIVQRLPVFKFDKSKFRQGQSDAFDETVLRIQHRKESHTAIVLPTRYGKSDYMRMTGLYLLNQGAVSGVMVMTPNRVLRNQVVSPEKITQSFRLYETRVERINRAGESRQGISPYNVVDRPRHELMTDSELVAATTSMVGHNLSAIVNWIDHLKHRYGVPPVIFFDEAHTAGDQNAWGKTIANLADAGAYIVLCTATPYRTDGQPIPGFQIETVSVEEMSSRQRLGAHVYLRQGRRVVYKLVAHHVTTFQQAWQESVLCQVSREPFDVDLREHGMDGYEDYMLSSLGEASSRRALYEAVRNPDVVRDGVRRLVRNLRYRRRDAPETAGIVFVGSDDGGDIDDEYDEINNQNANQYANMVQDALREEGPEFKVVIATSKIDGDPAQTIEEFSKGPRGGDVLVVKMMASAGLDIARLKVALDLSTVRTPVSFVQRVMRICTRWDRDSGEPVLRATYITPDECRGRELYNDLIYDLGGASATIQWDAETGEIIEEDFMPGQRFVPLTTWEVTGTQEGEFLADSDGTIAPGNTRPYVDDIFDENPDWSRFLGKAKLGDAIAKAAQEYAREQLGGIEEEPEVPSPPLADTYEDFIDNVQERTETLRQNIAKKVNAKAARQLRQALGTNFSKEHLGPEIRKTWRSLYQVAGIRWRTGVRPGDLLKTLNEDQLRKLWSILD